MSDEVIIRNEAGYNRQDPKAAPVLVFAAAIIGTLVAVFIFVTAYYGFVLETQQYRFQGEPIASDYMTIQANDAKLLNQYSFANKEKTAVRIPVSRAMELVLADAAEKKTWYSTENKPLRVDPAAAAATPAAAAPTGAAAPKEPAKPDAKK